MAISRYESSVASLGNDTVYGTGADGTVVISADTTLTTDMNYKNLTINSGVILKTNGFRVFVQGTLTLNGYIGHGTGAGAEPSSSVSAGTVAGTSTSTSLTYSVGNTGGGGTATTATQLPASYRQHINSLVNGKVIQNDGTITTISGGSAGSSGTAGATAAAYTAPDSWPGKAGATGSPGGAGAAGSNGTYPPNAAATGAAGGRGANGASGTAGASGSPGTVTNHTSGPGGAGGSGGVGGGIVLICAKTITGTGKVISRGISGVAGTAGSAGASGTPGGAGANGATGTPGAGAGTFTQPNAPGNSVSHAPHTGHPAFDSGHPNAPAGGASNGGQAGGSYSHHHYVAYDIHSHSNNVAPHNSRNHFGHTVPATTGHNHHYYNNGSRHGLTGANPGAGSGHYHGAIYGHNQHQHFNGSVHGNNATYRSYQPHFVHAGSPNYQRWTHTPSNHHAVAHPFSHPTPATVYNGGAGGAGGASGVGGAGGAGAPAVTGASGKRGGAGGGGGIIVITDSTPTGISYDTLAGQTADSDNFSGSAGYSYIVLNA